MASIRRGSFEELVRRAFDPVVTAYGFKLTPQPPADHVDEERAAAVYETTPAAFTRRFPDWTTLGIDHSGWCVDLWIETDLATNRVDVHLEGEPLRELAKSSMTSDPGDAPQASMRLEDALTAEAALCAVVLAARAAE